MSIKEIWLGNNFRVPATVKKIQAFGKGVYQVDFDLPSRYTRFAPGQFLHLALDEFDPTLGFWPESRVFSIASEPRHDTATVVYSVKGRFTLRMEAELSVGRRVWLKLPYGSFTIDPNVEGPIVLIAGGTGVAPYWPFLLADDARSVPVYLYYGIRELGHLLFADLLDRLGSRPWFHLRLFVEGGVKGRFAFEKGRLSINAVADELGNRLALADLYLSGPPVMITTFKQDLLVRGVSAHRIHIDEWE